MCIDHLRGRKLLILAAIFFLPLNISLLVKAIGGVGGGGKPCFLQVGLILKSF